MLAKGQRRLSFKRKRRTPSRRSIPKLLANAFTTTARHGNIDITEHSWQGNLSSGTVKTSWIANEDRREFQINLVGGVNQRRGLRVTCTCNRGTVLTISALTEQLSVCGHAHRVLTNLVDKTDEEDKAAAVQEDEAAAVQEVVDVTDSTNDNNLNSFRSAFAQSDFTFIDVDQVYQAIRARGFRYCAELGDGNCFFHVVARALHRTAQELRADTVRHLEQLPQSNGWLKDNWCFFTSFNEGKELRPATDPNFDPELHVTEEMAAREYKKFVDKVRQDGTYVEGCFLMQQICELFQIRLRVWQYNDVSRELELLSFAYGSNGGQVVNTFLHTTALWPEGEVPTFPYNVFVYHAGNWKAAQCTGKDGADMYRVVLSDDFTPFTTALRLLYPRLRPSESSGMQRRLRFWHYATLVNISPDDNSADEECSTEDSGPPHNVVEDEPEDYNSFAAEESFAEDSDPPQNAVEDEPGNDTPSTATRFAQYSLAGFLHAIRRRVTDGINNRGKAETEKVFVSFTCNVLICRPSELTRFVLLLFFQRSIGIFEPVIPKYLVDMVLQGRPWLEPPDGATVANGALLPWLYYLPKVYIWLPEVANPNHYRLRCPKCRGTNIKVHEITEGRHVFGEPCYYFFGRRYICTKCDSNGDIGTCSFTNYDPNVLKTMQFGVQHHMPCVFSHKMGLDKNLHARVVAPETVADTLARLFNERQREIYTIRRLLFMHSIVKLRRVPDVRGGFQTTINPFEQKLKEMKFSTFEDKDKYAGRTLHGQYLRQVVCTYHEKQKGDKLRQMGAWKARIISLDHSFKIVKLIRFKKEPVFEACLSIVNDAGQLLFTGLCHTKSLDAQRDQLLAALRDLPELQIIYTDDIDDVHFFSRLLPHMKVMRDPATVEHQAIHVSGVYALPATFSDTYLKNDCLISTAVACERTCNGLIQQLERKDWKGAQPAREDKCFAVVGLDIEWDRRDRQDLSLLQLCFQSRLDDTKKIVMFRMNSIFRNLQVVQQSALKALLEHPKIYFTGRNIGGDVSRLERIWNIKIRKQERKSIPETGKIIELGRFTMNRSNSPFTGLDGRVLPLKYKNASLCGTCSLATLCEVFLKRELDKAEQTSQWNAPQLSSSQVRYAAMDAAVSLDLYFAATSCTPVWARTHQSFNVQNALGLSASGVELRDSNNDTVGQQLQPLGNTENALERSDSPSPSQQAASVVAVPSSTTNVENSLDNVRVLLDRSRNVVAHASLVDGGDNNDKWCKKYYPNTRMRPSSQRRFVKILKVVDDNAKCIVYPRGKVGFNLRQHFEVDNTPILWKTSHMMLPDGHTWDIDVGVPTVIQRVLGDIFHVFGRFDRVTKHPAYGLFIKELRGAFFVDFPEDVKKVTKYLSDVRGLDERQIAKLFKARLPWIRRRVRRFVPGPAQLVERLRKCFAAFDGRQTAFVDPKTGKTIQLFGKQELSSIRQIVKAAGEGFLSDPFGTNLYLKSKARGTDDLQQWKCLRGTNGVEAWHRRLIAIFERQPSLSAPMAHVLLFELAFQYSVRNGQRFGRLPNFGHNNISLEEEVQRLHLFLWKEKAYKEWTVATNKEVPCQWGIQTVPSDAELYRQDKLKRR